MYKQMLKLQFVEGESASTKQIKIELEMLQETLQSLKHTFTYPGECEKAEKLKLAFDLLREV